MGYFAFLHHFHLVVQALRYNPRMKRRELLLLSLGGVIGACAATTVLSKQHRANRLTLRADDAGNGNYSRCLETFF